MNIIGLLMLALTLSTLSTKEVMSRSNYGTFINKVSAIHNSFSSWEHVYCIKILDYHEIQTFVSNSTICDSDRVNHPSYPIICDNYAESLRSFTSMKSKLLTMIDKNRQQLTTFLQDKLLTRTRQKRGLVDFGGILLNKLFGVSTEGQLNELSDRINYVENNFAEIQDEFLSVASNLHSFQTVTNERID